MPPITDGVTPLNAANLVHKSGVDTITGQHGFTKAVATPGGFNFTQNGDMETWAAGAAAAPAGWTLTGAGASVARDGANFKVGTYAAALTRAGADCYLAQDITTLANVGPAARWRGRDVVLGAWVRATVASRARLVINDGVGSTLSSYHSGGGAWEFLTVTRAIDAAATKLELRGQVDTGDTVAQFDAVMLAMGTALGESVPSGVTIETAAPTAKSRRGLARGLVVYNDPAAPNSRVRVVADELWLANGSDEVIKVTGVDVTADLAAAGAGGLDTGAEAASTEYDLYVIASGDGATKNALWSKGLQWAQDQLYADANRDGARALRDVAGNTYVAQGFQVAEAGKLHSVEVSILRIGAPAGSMWAEVWDDNAGNPSAILAGGRGIVIPVDDVDATTRVRLRVIFPERPSLGAATQYHVVFRGDYAVGAAHVTLGLDTTAPGYANGQVKTSSDGAAWTAQAEDLAIFAVNTLRGSELAPTLPSGYTHWARVSWNRNDGSSNLLRMVQEGAVWRHVAHTETSFTVSLAWTAYDFATLVCAAWARAYHVAAGLNGAQLVVTPSTFPVGSPAITTVIATKQRGPGWSGNSGGVSSEVVSKPGFLGPMFWATVSAGSGHVFSIQGQELEV